jgi:hypothetical protein
LSHIYSSYQRFGERKQAATYQPTHDRI